MLARFLAMNLAKKTWSLGGRMLVPGWSLATDGRLGKLLATDGRFKGRWAMDGLTFGRLRAPLFFVGR